MTKKLFVQIALMLFIIYKPLQAMETVELTQNIVIESPLFFENKKVIIKEGTKIVIKGLFEHAIHIKNGALYLIGSNKNPIIVQSENTHNKEIEDYNVFFLENSQGVIKHAHFSMNSWVFHLHFSDVVIKNCLFEKNYGAIRLTGGKTDIYQNIFRDNYIAVRFLNSEPKIEENIFYGNYSAIFIREGVKNPIITKNLFYKNQNDFFVGFFQSEEIKAPSNVFFDAPKVFDKNRDSSLNGLINITPYNNKFPDWH